MGATSKFDKGKSFRHSVFFRVKANKFWLILMYIFLSDYVANVFALFTTRAQRCLLTNC